jgi:hypothetical protein
MNDIALFSVILFEKGFYRNFCPPQLSPIVAKKNELVSAIHERTLI